MTEIVRINRRLFLARLGKGTMALAVLGACGSDTGGSSTTAAASTTGPASTAASTTTAGAIATTTTTAAPSTGLAEYLRVDLGFVSAYVVVRGSEAAVVDTGVSGSEAAIEAALGTVDLGWDAVGHVILTHHHPDHVGSMPAVLNAAAAAAGYIGEGDLDNVSSPRELLRLNDGDEVFGLTVIGTPGHTAGHISLLDPVASVLIAGDALNGNNGAVAGPNPQFSEDHNEALATVGRMAGYEYETLYFGHGEPVFEGASALVADLAESQ
ncbi:MAG TPA: MBL fold metallo-hydrolase [Acidimicrobiia bacterium]|nr:MBL fold metallo-hydrolase [Acidimicrobiia bacterium]